MLQEEFEYIEKYLEGSLEGIPLEEFRARLKRDPDFAKTVQEQKILVEVLEEEGLRNRLNKVHQQLFETQTSSKLEPSGKRITLSPWIRYAAVACVGLVLGWLGFNYLGDDALGSKDASEQLFAAHFKPDPGLPTTMSAADNYDFFEAMVSYKQGDYTMAIDKWTSLLKEKPQNDTLNYFVGVAHLANGDEKDAITFLQATQGATDSMFSDEINHYLGLAHLKNGDVEKALVELKKSKQQKSKELIQLISNVEQ